MIIDLSRNSKKYCGIMPVSLRCFNKNDVEVSDWNAVFVEVCRVLYSKNPIRFEKATRTETFSRVILPSAQNMRKPAMFAAGHYVETDFHEYEIIDWIKRLIDRLGIAPEAIAISYSEQTNIIQNKETLDVPNNVDNINSANDAVQNDIDPKDLYKIAVGDFKKWNGILKYDSVTSFSQFVYTRPESLTVYSGVCQIESSRDAVCYSFTSWADVLERILVLLVQTQPDNVLFCLKNYCSSVVSSVISTNNTGLTKPMMLFEQNYIDLSVFAQNIPVAVECICILVRILHIEPEKIKIHFVIDENAADVFNIVENLKFKTLSKNNLTVCLNEMNDESDIKTDPSENVLDDAETNVNIIENDACIQSVSEVEKDDVQTDLHKVESMYDETETEADDKTASVDDNECVDDNESVDDRKESFDDSIDSDTAELNENKESVKKRVYYQFSLKKNYSLWADGVPVSLYWRGAEISVDSWPELFEEFCDRMMIECSDQFVEILINSGLVVEDKDELRLPYHISGEELYIETDRPAARMMQLMDILCSECGIPGDEIEIETSEWEEVMEDDDEDESYDDDEDESYDDDDDESYDDDDDESYDDDDDESYDDDDDESYDDDEDESYDDDDDESYDDDEDESYDDDDDESYDDDDDESYDDDDDESYDDDDDESYDDDDDESYNDDDDESYDDDDDESYDDDDDESYDDDDKI